MEGIAAKEGVNGAGAQAPKLKRSTGVWTALLPAGIPVYVLWWQAKQAEKQAAELVATPPPPRSPVREGAVVAMKKGSR